MASTTPASSWRESRRQAAREAIVDAAWELVRAEGLAALNLRDLAKQAGITTPTVYAYFDSKHAIYDAMFGRAASDFLEHMEAPFTQNEPRGLLREASHRFIEFCVTDSARYQLLFQRTIPGFEPSTGSYAPAVRALDGAHQRFAQIGITDARMIDLWTALLTGLVDQQLSNDPGGDRWSRLANEAVDMFLSHIQSTTTQKGRRRDHKG